MSGDVDRACATRRVVPVSRDIVPIVDEVGGTRLRDARRSDPGGEIAERAVVGLTPPVAGNAASAMGRPPATVNPPAGIPCRQFTEPKGRRR
jgi:hypothetical protein